ncbi:hypothetical protein ASC97_30525 [Rhizobium sp. Root1203]|uniref:NADP-dependent oxidoreductase n=1 Tax=Rhizobium sp. Root1203 TaxID=1736427 RepID=UPI00070D28B0|nr:NADP-dependent oxidoreductase [Rhizobium sp. Root1203]KQV17309.1 hypothetical protein ASC97_30525 [Rhizobium sp. Root1203]
MPRVVVFSEYGPPDVLHVVDRQEPVPAPNEVLIRVEAAGVQPFDAMFRAGYARQWAPAHFPQPLGNEFAGTIVGIGENLREFKIGDRVLGWSRGDAYADVITVPANQMVIKPEHMSWPEAGALSASGQTASTALGALDLAKGETLLVHAAAGGVGSFAVQIAVEHGIRVIGTASEVNHDYLRELGAIPVDYHGDLVANVRAVAPSGIDASLIAVGGEPPLEASVALVSNRTRIVTVAFEASTERYGITRVGTQRSQERLLSLTALYDAGKLHVPVGQVFALTEAADAHRLIETGHSRGKAVIVTQ